MQKGYRYVLRAPCNFFGVDASQPLSEWKRKGWIHPDDPRGWFQWYCRYYMGRRMPAEDRRQINRWKATAACPAGAEVLRAGRPSLPTPPAAGTAALGLRQPQNLRRFYPAATGRARTDRFLHRAIIASIAAAINPATRTCQPGLMPASKSKVVSRTRNGET